MKQINPPYDGSPPCPMCNETIRGASATIHNFLDRWPDGRAFVKLNDLRNYWKRPAEVAVPHPDVTELMEVADALVAACSDMTDSGTKIAWTPETYAKVEALVERARANNEKISMMSELHFDDARHCSGNENGLYAQRGYSKERGGDYDWFVRQVETGGDLRHTVCGARFELHDHFKERLARDPKFYGTMGCDRCGERRLPFAQFEAVQA